MSLFYRKPLSALRADSEHSLLKRTLGPVQLTALGIGSVIGTGIFVLTGTAAARNAGPGLMISMILAGIACAFAGLCYGELASMIPVAGSAYTYAFATVGELVAWIIGWDLVLEYALATATVAVGWSGYFASLMHTLGIDLPTRLVAAPGVTVTLADGTVTHGFFNVPAFLIVLVVSALLTKGIRESANANTVMVVIKALVLVVFVIAGWSYVTKANHTPIIPPNTGEFGSFGWSGVFRATGVIFFAFIGFDAVSTAAQEARNPQRDMPIGILTSLAICTVIYVAVAYVLTGIVHYSKLNVADPLAVGIDATGLTWLSPVIKVSALFGMFSTMLVQLLGQTRIFYTMSRDGLLPGIFGKVHARFRTPHISTMLTGTVCALAAGLTPIEVLGLLVSMGTLFAFVLACIGVLILRRTQPDAPRPFRTPGMPWVPVVGALACFGQMLVLPGDTWLRLFIWLAVGFVIYFGYSRHRAAALRAQAAAAGAASTGSAALPA